MPRMPSDRHKQYHLHGFLGRQLNRFKSKSIEQLCPQTIQPDKRAFSSRDLSSRSPASYKKVIAELKQNHFGALEVHDWANHPAIVEQVEEAECSKARRWCSVDTFHSSVQHSVYTGRQQVMSVVVTPPSSRPASPGSISALGVVSADNEVDLLEKTLQNVRIKLKELLTERVDMEKRVDSLSTTTENIYSQQYSLNSSKLTFSKSDTHNSHQEGNSRPHSQDCSRSELKPHVHAHKRRGERFKSNMRHYNWAHSQIETEQGKPIGGDVPRMSLSPPPLPSKFRIKPTHQKLRLSTSFTPSSSKVVSAGEATHHRLRLSTSFTPPTSPMGQDEYVSSQPIPEHGGGAEQSLFYSSASSAAYQTKSQPEPATIPELDVASGAKIMKFNPVKKKSSPMSKIAILRRRSVNEFNKNSTKTKLTRKTSYEGTPFSQELRFSSTSNFKQNHGWSFN